MRSFYSNPQIISRNESQGLLHLNTLLFSTIYDAHGRSSNNFNFGKGGQGVCDFNISVAVVCHWHNKQESQKLLLWKLPLLIAVTGTAASGLYHIWVIVVTC